MEIYYFGSEGQKIGPITKEGLIRLAEAGIVTEETLFDINGQKVKGRKIKNLLPIFAVRSKDKSGRLATSSDEKTVDVPSEAEKDLTLPPQINDTNNNAVNEKTVQNDDNSTGPSDNSVLSGIADDYQNSFVKRYQILNKTKQPDSAEGQLRSYTKLWCCLVVIFLLNIVLIAGTSFFIIIHFKGNNLKHVETEVSPFSRPIPEAANEGLGTSEKREQADLETKLESLADENKKSIDNLNNRCLGIEQRISDIEQHFSEITQNAVGKTEQTANNNPLIEGNTVRIDRRRNDMEFFSNQITEIDNAVTQIASLSAEIKRVNKELFEQASRNYETKLSLTEQKIFQNDPFLSTDERALRDKMIDEKLDRQDTKNYQSTSRLETERDRKKAERDQIINTCLELAEQAMNIESIDSSIMQEKQRIDAILERTSELTEMLPNDYNLQTLNNKIKRLKDWITGISNMYAPPRNINPGEE